MDAAFSSPKFQNLGPNINSAKDDFLPVVYKDTLYYKRTLNDKSSQFMILKIACKDIAYPPGNIFPSIMNIYNPKDFHNSAFPIDSKESTGGSVSFDPSTPSFYLFTSDKSSSGYILDKPKKIEEISSNHNDMHPAFSPDGKYMVFASDRSKTKGVDTREKDTDLYITYRKKDGSWTAPKNLGKEINTKQNEIAPFIAPDGTLYYSSKGFILDSVNSVFSGEGIKSNSLSDIYLVNERLNYNIIKASATGITSKPFGNPQILPRPFNSEFNEVAATVWKDSLLIIASDRIAPFYDRPDPMNQKGYDLYGFIQFDSPNDDILDSIPVFVTGYYIPLTPASLKELNKKIENKIFRTNQENSYIADPKTEIDENKVKLNYQFYSEMVENYFKAKAYQISQKAAIDQVPFTVRINGYSDIRKINPKAEYLEKDIQDKAYIFELKNGEAMDNIVLSKIRAYNTMIYLKSLVEKFPSMLRLKDNIKWEFDGRGATYNVDGLIKQRKIEVEIIDKYNLTESK
jgi:hypothetical protein